MPEAKAPSGPACPVCGRPRAEPFRPFCSRRCADLDLVAWLRGDYAVPGEPAGDGEERDDAER